MGIPDYSHAEKEQIFQQFTLLPEVTRVEFLRDVTNSPDIASDPNRIAAGMQELINQHVTTKATEAHPFAALLAGRQDVLGPLAAMQGGAQLANPVDSGQLGTQLAAQTQQRDAGDLGLLA